jgi:hypothetical protein
MIAVARLMRDNGSQGLARSALGPASDVYIQQLAAKARDQRLF